jgi:site-specific recombinase XerD
MEVKLLDRVRQAIRIRHYSRRTEQAYTAWIRRFIVFHGKRHPRELGEREVTAFVSHLAERGVSASTQNQALSAILFLFDVVLGERLAWMNEIVRARRPVRLPVVLSRPEVSALLSRLLARPKAACVLVWSASIRVGGVDPAGSMKRSPTRRCTRRRRECDNLISGEGERRRG